MILKNHTNRQPFVNGLNYMILQLVILGFIVFLFYWIKFYFLIWPAAKLYALFAVIPALIIGLIKNRAVSFSFDDAQLSVKKGVIMKSEAIVNYRNITNITVFQNLFDVIFNQGTLQIWTYSDYPDIVLYLNKKDAEFLRNHIMGLTK